MSQKWTAGRARQDACLTKRASGCSECIGWNWSVHSQSSHQTSTAEDMHTTKTFTLEGIVIVAELH